MTEFDIDLTKVPDLKPVPDGSYILRCASFEPGTSNTGNPKVTFKFDIEGPKEQKDEVGSVYMDFSLVQAALWRLLRFVKACGLELGPKFKPKLCVGKTVCAICSVDDTPEWGVRNRWNLFYPATGRVAKANRPQKDVDDLVERNAMRNTSSAGGKDDKAGGGDEGGIW